MKDGFLEQISDIPEEDIASLIRYVRKLTESITSYPVLGIDDRYYNELETFREQSQALLNAYDTPEIHQADDIYWLLYWATCDSSLQTTYNGYNYLHLLLSLAVRDKLNQINVKEYIKSIIKLIKVENLIK